MEKKAKEHTCLGKVLFLVWMMAPWLTGGAQTDLKLDARHLLLDGSLTAAQAKASPYVFNDFREAMAHFQDTTTLYIRPWVYWVDNPDVPEVVKGKDGREPFGMVIRGKKLALVGLGQQPGDVVLASQRGQMQGAVGNFTMLDMHTDELHVENLTMGNYCNVDLDYQLRPELSRKRRSDAITQAHVGYVHGRQLTARKVRFISRLNLNPLNGARESVYDSCHFECTDDALNGGHAIYRHCDFDLYGAKPMWSTFGTGPLFYDCDFYVRTDNRETYFCKQGGPVTVVDCRYHAPEGSYVGWTAYPQPWLRCYQQNFTLNGKPYSIGSRRPQNTVVMKDKLLWHSNIQIPFLAISQHEANLRAPAEILLTTDSSATWSVTKGFERFVLMRQLPEGRASFFMTNETDETADFCLVATTPDGRQAACRVVLQPSLVPAPQFLRQPDIVQRGDSLTLDYVLDLQGRHDESHIEWLRDGIVVSTSHDAPQRSYRLTGADAGRTITATIAPKSNRSDFAPAVVASMAVAPASEQNVGSDTAATSSAVALETDFHDFPCQWQPQIIEGYWTVDGYKPLDTEAFDWQFSQEKPMWEYGEGFNGAVGRGLLQAQRGARLMYTPMKGRYGDMSLTLQVDPTKTAGQGFGSATGQYMDVCLKFDTRTLTGYGLRIIRTVKHAKAVDFLLVAYKNGVVTPLTEPVSSTCYRTGCTIRLDYADGQLTAHVETKTPKPADSQLPHQVDLQVRVPATPFGGIHIQHTGSCGESTTMLHRLYCHSR